MIVHPKQEDREALRRFFSEADYNVLVTGTEQEAMELCRDYENAIHVLVTDVVLPGASGWKLAETASKVRPGLLVLFLSAACVASTPAETLQKKPAASASLGPVTPAMLTEIIRTLNRPQVRSNTA